MRTDYVNSQELAQLVKQYRRRRYRKCPDALAVALVTISTGVYARYDFGSWYPGEPEDFGHDALIHLLGRPCRKVDVEAPGNMVFNFFTKAARWYGTTVQKTTERRRRIELEEHRRRIQTYYAALRLGGVA